MTADGHYGYPSISSPTFREVFSFLFSNQNFACISHHPKINNHLIFLATINESPSHTTFSILPSFPPSLHFHIIPLSSQTPAPQKAPSGTQTSQTFYTASLFV